ncbi:MAG: glycoside hydrolase TIM-barrel-like domain-containing protein, partial [Rhizobiaceae bacterium]
ALVATWFGDDLRAGNCRIRPMAVDNGVDGFSEEWLAGGLTRAEVPAVSRHAGNPAYGGTPSDRSIIDAIAEIRARGLGVTLYPFIMMDLPAGNALTDPYGGSAQAPYPWRGRITGAVAPGRVGTTDKTAAARSQIDAFCGAATPENFSFDGTTVNFAGSSSDWGYCRFLLHFAKLAQAAGGVDAFLLGSELRGLTTLRDNANAFPFVEQLCTLAGEVRAILGPSTKITYGADWTEYFGHQPADGSSDVYFHLDPFWAHAAVDAVGIDYYMPAADWRDSDHGGGNPDGFAGPYDPAGLQRSIAGGEGFDWYYASDGARNSRTRSAITDGGYGKPWVFRYKDLVGWWSNQHFNRPGGVEAASPTAWVPQGKPLWLTELGCPAIDRGPNQPNVFPDPKSSESASPFFSGQGRSDLAQRRFIAAHQQHWDASAPGFDGTKNPLSRVYGGRMVSSDRVYLWSWDARPFPAFPQRADAWSDGANWTLGHWLSGRLSGLSLGELINAILADHGLPTADVDYADGALAGYVISDPRTARSALDPLIDVYGLDVIEDGGGLAFRSSTTRMGSATALAELAVPERDPTIERTRSPDHRLPAAATLGFRDPLRHFQAATARAVRPGAPGAGEETVGFPGVLETAEAETLIRDWLRRRWAERETVAFALPPNSVAIVPGTRVRLPGEATEYVVTGVEEGLTRQVSARAVMNGASRGGGALPPAQVPEPDEHVARPHCLLLDLPLGPGETEPTQQFRIAAWARPWRAQRAWVSPETTGFSERAALLRPATIGTLAEPLAPGAMRGIVRRGPLVVTLLDGEFASVSRAQLLNGANVLAVRSLSGAWEVLQFETAEEFSAATWRLSGLLRGQLGTTDAMLAGSAAGADAVLLDEAVRPAGQTTPELGLTLNWRVAPTGRPFLPGRFFEETITGGMRARQTLSPVHLRAQRLGTGDLAVGWIRCGRIDADSWDGMDIPLGEEAEAYRIEVRTTGGVLRRDATVSSQLWTYAASAIAADFPVLPATVDLSVMQIGAIGPGLPATRRITLS